MANTSEDGTPSLSDIERRLRSLEDQLAIHRIIMTHPPAADTGNAEFWLEIQGDSGLTDYGTDPGQGVGDLVGLVTAAQLTGWTSSPQFQAAQQAGLAHVASAPVVVVTGDEASAWNYHQTIIREENGFRVFRLFSNHWKFSRSAHGWHLDMRKCRLIDGNEQALDILRGAVSASTALLDETDET